MCTRSKLFYLFFASAVLQTVIEIVLLHANHNSNPGTLYDIVINVKFDFIYSMLRLCLILCIYIMFTI